MTAVVMVVVMVVADSAWPWRRHCDSRDRDCREGGDEFDLVHDVVPFFALRKPILALTPG